MKTKQLGGVDGILKCCGRGASGAWVKVKVARIEVVLEELCEATAGSLMAGWFHSTRIELDKQDARTSKW